MMRLPELRCSSMGESNPSAARRAHDAGAREASGGERKRQRVGARQEKAGALDPGSAPGQVTGNEIDAGEKPRAAGQCCQHPARPTAHIYNAAGGPGQRAQRLFLGLHEA